MSRRVVITGLGVIAPLGDTPAALFRSQLAGQSGIGRITRLVPEGESWWLSVRVPEDLRRYVAEKGSIAIDGISLTVARWQDGVADIAIIPFTHEHTNAHAMTVNDAVNLETDILAKYVESLLHAKKSSVTSHLKLSDLKEQGF